MRRPPRWAWLVAALVAAALLAVPLGGWEHVDRADARTEQLRPGETHEGERFATAVERAEVLPVRPGSSLDPEPGVAYLAVHARLENATEQTQTPPYDHLVVAGADLGSADSVVLVRDPAGSAALQPGLAEEVAFVWQLEEGDVAPGEVVRVQVVDRDETESLVGAGTVWLFPHVGAALDLTVEGAG